MPWMVWKVNCWKNINLQKGKQIITGAVKTAPVPFFSKKNLKNFKKVLTYSTEYDIIINVERGNHSTIITGGTCYEGQKNSPWNSEYGYASDFSSRCNNRTIQELIVGEGKTKNSPHLRQLHYSIRKDDFQVIKIFLPTILSFFIILGFIIGFSPILKILTLITAIAVLIVSIFDIKELISYARKKKNNDKQWS